MVNTRANFERWGGVRAVGSTLERRVQLHEAENGGSDVVVMTVQTDASASIEQYSQATADLTFILLGYWNTGSFVETWQAFSAGPSGAWQSQALGAYGVPADSVVEVVVANTSASASYSAGVRGAASADERRLDIHEAEGGGVDVLTLLANADAGSQIEVYAESDASIDFYLAGYWSDPPGSYSESTVLVGKPLTSATWETADLSAIGVPVDSVANIVMLNAQSDTEAQLGVRATGSSLQRVLGLQEAEGGGSDLASTHVNVGAGGQIEWYDADTQNHEFWLVGWWVLSP